MSIQPLGLFEDDQDSSVKEEVAELKEHLKKFLLSKKKNSDSLKEMKEHKRSINMIFNKLPEEIKTTTNDTPTTIAGKTFNRIRKTIEVENNLIILKERVNTTFDREQVFKVIEDAPKQVLRDTKEIEIAERVTDHIVEQINLRMKPNLSGTMSIEKKKGK